MSVVDYAAWRKGYMPPTEHVLIHELSHEGAKVVAMSSAGRATWWFVVKGNVDRKTLSAASKHLHMTIDVFDEPTPSPEAMAALDAEYGPRIK